MSATTFGRRLVVDYLTGTGLWMALFTSDPGLSGSLLGEVSGGGYARVSLDGLMTAADSGGISTNTEALNFGPATDDWGTVRFVGFMDAETGGNLILPGSPAVPKTVTAGLPFQIAIGRLRLRAI